MPTLIEKAYNYLIETSQSRKQINSLRKVFDIMNQNLTKFMKEVRKTELKFYSTESVDEKEFLKGCKYFL